MQGKWFGGWTSEGRSGISPLPNGRSIWFNASQMTATATIYTPFGFAIAADGLQRWGHQPTRDASVIEDESDAVQKIFMIRGEHVALAYLLRGDIANRDRSFDLGCELRSLITSVKAEAFTECRQFVQTLSGKLEDRILIAQADHRLDNDLPAAEITFIGYFKNDPCWIDAKFHRSRNPYTGTLHEVAPIKFYPGFCFVSGSLPIRDLIRKGDPRFAPFCARFDYRRSLEDASGFVKGYIEACCSPMALLVDPSCEELGGRIHVATVTPEDGFQWIVEPIAVE
jgi:hypothetical protein